MGVQGLWELLAPVGRRVSVESLGSRRLAIDASIWIIQFMKAMRDDRGDMIRNAHLLGFFRRICKLLFLRIKPVFVFDGGTPALKRRTVIARRRQREQAQSKIRKTAEKLLLNHLRTRRLEEIAGGLGSLPPQPKPPPGRCKKAHITDGLQEENDNSREVSILDGGRLESPVSHSRNPAMSYGGMREQESADALLAASLAGGMEEDKKDSDRQKDQCQGPNGGQSAEEDEDEEELVYLPAAQGKLDPAVLASLPPSMQLDLLVQMREQLVAENRQKFEKVAKAPSSFSQLQIEAYLKTVAFRREINLVQKAAAGRGVGGVPSARIASETNREFIFTSSYQGDKMALTGANGGNPMLNALKVPEPSAQPPAAPSSSFLSANYRALIETNRTELEDANEKADNSVHTYVDEKGRTRVSRIRGMGVRMTRDLQWNLYLMKDVEKRQALEESNEDDGVSAAGRLVSNGDGELFQRLMLGDKANFSESLSGYTSKQRVEALRDLEAGTVDETMSRGLEITLDETVLAGCDSDDGELFDRLVAVEGNSWDGGDSHKNSTVDAEESQRFSAAVGSNGVSQPSGLQISFDGKEEAEDMNLFKNLVGGEAMNSLENFESSKKSSSVTTFPEDQEQEEVEEECEWEDGDIQGRGEVGIANEPKAKANSLAEMEADLNGDAEMVRGVQERLQEHMIIREVFQCQSEENKCPLPDDDDAELAAQIALAIQKSLEENVESNKLPELQPHADRTENKYIDTEAKMPLANHENIHDRVQGNSVEAPQPCNGPQAGSNFSLPRGKEEQMAPANQESLQENVNTDRVAELQQYVHAPPVKKFSLAGDSDAEMALAIQQSLAEHDRTRSLQPEGYLESEDTGMSDDSDTGNSDESEVEWEDGSGAVAVPGAGFTITDPGVLITEEDAELQEAIRRSLDDVGSWKMPVRALPQLVIREPIDDSFKTGSMNSPGLGSVTAREHQPPTGVDKILDMESEEARLARERARKGKAVAGEMNVSPVAVVRKAVLQPAIEPEGDLLQEAVKGKSVVDIEVEKHPLGPLHVDAKFISPMGANVAVSPVQKQQFSKEGKENVPHLSLGMKTDNRFEAANIDGVRGGEKAGIHVDNQNEIPFTNGIRRDVQASADTEITIEVPHVNGIRRGGEPGTLGERPVASHGRISERQMTSPSGKALPVPVSEMAMGSEDTRFIGSKTGDSRVAPAPLVDQPIDQESTVGNATIVAFTQLEIPPNTSENGSSHTAEQNATSGMANDQAIAGEAKGHMSITNGLGVKVIPKSKHPGFNPKDMVDTANMLKDAEELDEAKEREEMLKHEAELLVEREALAREEAELQAALEEGQEEFRAGIEKERELLFQEEIELQEVQKKNERNADSVTGEMFAECQELLQMFGLPYIIAPMEAEAQCAYMDTMQLVDGVVTDDCDVFLFGGRNIYKNIFDDRKYVETYYMKDIETEMGLSREKLIRMALLLGSDYTEGISGIGIVNAIEVVNSFDEEDGLRNFKEMVDSPDFSLFGLQDKGSKKKGSHGKQKGAGEKDKKGGGTEAVGMLEEDDVDGAPEVGDGDDVREGDAKLHQQAFMENHRAVSKNWKIPDSFPSDAVVAAYAAPQVDKSTDPFTWGRPDLEALRKFCYERFSWPKDKADDLLLPVLKEYDRRETQLRMDAFYSFNQRFAKVRSARIQKALRGTKGRRLSNELVDTSSQQEGPPPAKKARKKKGKEAADSAVTNTPELLLGGEGDPKIGKGRGRGTSRGRGRGRTSQGAKPAAASVDEQPLEQSQGLEDTEVRQGIGRGRSKKNGRGKGKGRGQARSSVGTVADDDDSSSSQSGSEGAASEILEKAGGSKRKADGQLQPPRRSGRARTEAVYNDPEGSDDGATGSERSADELPSGSRSAKSAHLKSTGSAHPAIATNPRISGTQAAQLLVLKQELPESFEDRRDGTQPSSATVYASGGGFCTSDHEKDAANGSLRTTAIESGGGFVRSDDEDGPAAERESAEPPEYFITGGGFCATDEDDASPPSKEHQGGSQTRDVSMLETSDPNVVSNGHVGPSQCTFEPLIIPGLSPDTETAPRVEAESTSAELLQASVPADNAVEAVRLEASADVGLRAMPMLRRKRPATKP